MAFSTRFGDGLQQVVDRACFEGFDGMLIERRYDHKRRDGTTAEIGNDIESSHHRHLQVEENEVGPKEVNERQSLQSAVVRLANHIDVRKQLQLFAQHLTGNRFIVDDQNTEWKVHGSSQY